MKRILPLFIMAVSAMAVHAQNKLERVTVPGIENAATKSPLMTAKFLGFSNPPSLDKSWQPFLYHEVSRNESEDNEMLEKIKEVKNRLKQSSEGTAEAKSTAADPMISNNFAGVDNGGTSSPLDNTVAISNNGIIVAFVNSKVGYYDVNGSLLYSQSMYNLINNLSLVNNICDPKVIYDNVADRFITYAQTCDATSVNSAVILGFSKTNNPQDGWYFYAFTGNPLSDGSWFDYPKLGISNDELFVTGNLFNEFSGQFNQAVIYQVPKAPCYAGANVNWNYWYNINGNPFTILPLSWGQQGSYGPGLNLVSTAGATNGSTNINLYQVTNNIASGTAQLNLYNVNTTNYSTAGDAQQQGSASMLDAGDCRSLDGFYLNGIIHFVFHSDIGSGWNGINYNRLTVSNATNVSSTFGLAGSYDYCYPAVASIGANTSDKSVIIAFERSSAAIYPETRVVACDDAGNWSNSTLVKAGQSYIHHTWNSNPSERWGDYTGICRKYNDNPSSVWMAGMYGNNSHYWSQWIAKIGFTTGIDNIQKDEYKAKVYPNPVVDNYRVEFELDANMHININITDIQGKVVKDLFDGNATSGKNLFTFNKANLSAGTYFLNIFNKTSMIKHEQMVISNR